MRRRLATLTLALAAGTLASGTPAHAYPVCARAFGESMGQEFDTQQTCASYPYGVDCFYQHAWDLDTHTDVVAVVCIPGILP